MILIEGPLQQNDTTPIRAPSPGNPIRILSLHPTVSPTFWPATPTLGCRKVSDIFYFSFVWGRGKGGGVGVQRGEGYLLFGTERGGRVFEEGRRGGGHRGWEGVVGRGGGAKYFFSGPKCPPSWACKL